MTPKQEDALRDYLQEVIVPLIEEVLVKKLGQAMTFAKEELIKPKREWVGLTDEEIEDAIDDGFAFGLDDGNVSNQMVIRYVRVIEAKLRSKN